METQPEKFLKAAQILTRLPISRSTWLAGVKSGKYPACIRISERIRVWKASEIESLIQSLSN